jgi:hypothetical protein
MYEICVGACGISPQYFKTQMTVPEAAALIRGYKLRQRVGYDQARLVARVVASCLCSNLPEDFLKFPWEEEQERKSPEEEAKELEALRAMVPFMERLMNQQQNNGQ